MADAAPPTLKDDEAAFARYAAALADGVAAVVALWFGRLVDSRSPGLTSSPDVLNRLEAGATLIAEEVRSLLARDIADQSVGPLEVLRRAVRFPTAELVAAHVPSAARDEFALRNFPNDVYGLTPASFGEVDPSLHELGLMWGAAKAHVHLRRRREGQVGPAA